MTRPGVSRRRFIGACAAGLGTACAAGNTWPAGAADGGQPASLDLAGTVFEAFQRHRLVAIGEYHGLQEHHDALVTLLTDPRFPELADDVVIEFGNSLHQDVADRFMLALQPVQNAELRRVWRDNTDSPLATWDEPVYEDFFRVLHAANWRLPAGRRIRLLLGDPPIDWTKTTTAGQVTSLRNQRDAFAASLVEHEVLSKGRRALICYGASHVLHQAAGQPPPRGVVSLIEQQTGQRVFSLIALTPLAKDPGGTFGRLAHYPRGIVIPAAGTWLGPVNSGDVLSPVIAPGPSGQPTNINCGVPLGSVIDGGLYLGQASDLTMSRPDPAIYLDQAYWAELQRRNMLQGGVSDLNALRQEQSARFTPQAIPPSLLCP
jgi:hypothetical protein